MSHRQIDIESRFGGYQVTFLPSLTSCLNECRGDAFWFLVDETVHRLYSSDFASVPSARVVTWKATEENKTFAKLETLFGALLDAGLKKNSRLVVVGGGILQDAGGFVASTVYRGISWDLIPTTLLAQADSCIGAKTSVNLPRAKNILGSFSAPKRVLLTTAVLKTLTVGDVKSGLAEAVKLGIVDGASSVEWMTAHLEAAIDGSQLDEFLYRSLLIKKRFIEEDEFDRGVRNLLNVGHTFAHAFEAVTNYEIPHGIAVGLGMRAAAFFSVRKEFAPMSFLADVNKLMKPLTESSFPLIQKFAAAKYIGVMKSDKKNISSDIMFILGRGHGELFKQPLSATEAESLLSDFLKSV